MLFFAARIAEAKIDKFNIVLLNHFKYIFYRHVCCLLG